MRNLQVVVIGDAEASPEQVDFCEKLGCYLGEKRYTVITGGRSGVMEAVSKGVREAGGITVGILPGTRHSDANRWCTVIIPTGMGHARNSITALSADVIISIGGKAGTLTELGFGWIFHKPIISVSRFGGWSAELSGKKIDTRRTDAILEVDSLEALKTAMDKVVKMLEMH